jgi:thiamine-monophosphate kinase
MLDESTLIQTLQKSFPLPDGIGDDAALLPLSDLEKTLFSTDLLVEDVHFRRRYTDLKSLAHKILHVNLSDIAAMGAKPHSALLSLAIPPNALEDMPLFLQYFIESCQAAQVNVIGGDTTGAPGKLFISLTVIGTGFIANIKRRSTAQPGNILAVAGPLGYAHLGLLALENDVPGLQPFKEAFLRPTARCPEGLWFGRQSAVTAMMDISDGLWLDAQKLCEASGVSATIPLENLDNQTDIQSLYISACHALQVDGLETKLIGGEDYGLLVAVQPDAYSKLAQDFQQQFGYTLQPIGTLGPFSETVIRLTRNNVPVQLDLKPFSHFKLDPSLR